MSTRNLVSTSESQITQQTITDSQTKLTDVKAAAAVSTTLFQVAESGVSKPTEGKTKAIPAKIAASNVQVFQFRPSKFANLMEQIEAAERLYPTEKPLTCCGKMYEKVFKRLYQCCLCSSSVYKLDLMLENSNKARRILGIQTLLTLSLYFLFPVPFISFYLLGGILKFNGTSSTKMPYLGGAVAALGLHLLMYFTFRVVVVRKKSSGRASLSTKYLWCFLLLSFMFLTFFSGLLTVYLSALWGNEKKVVVGKTFLPLFLLIIMSGNCFTLALAGVSMNTDYSKVKMNVVSLVITVWFLLGITLAYSYFFDIQVFEGRVHARLTTDVRSWFPILAGVSLILSVLTSRELQMLMSGRRLPLNSDDWLLATSILTWSFLYPSILSRIYGKCVGDKSKIAKVAPDDDNPTGVSGVNKTSS